MKTLKLFFLATIIIASYTLSAQVIITTDDSDPDASSMLEVKSTDKGFLPPRMTETQRDAISNPVAGLQIFNTTSSQPNYFNGSKWQQFDGMLLEPLSIGDFYQGGIVFYLDGIGGGLICAKENQTSAAWGCTIATGATGTAIGTGEQNTNTIMGAACETDGIAADICANLFLNGYDDWFLPSYLELREMYNNRVVINATAQAVGGSSFMLSIYQSSTETDATRMNAMNFSNGVGTIYGNKTLIYNVRAVRAF